MIKKHLFQHLQVTKSEIEYWIKLIGIEHHQVAKAYALFLVVSHQFFVDRYRRCPTADAQHKWLPFMLFLQHLMYDLFGNIPGGRLRLLIDFNGQFFIP